LVVLGLAVVAVVVFSVHAGASRDKIGLHGNLRGEGQASQFQDVNYDMYEWVELPPQAKRAATFLGYTKRMWDNNRDPPIVGSVWTNMSEDQIAAAKKLGYNGRNWPGGPGTAGIGTMPPTSEYTSTDTSEDSSTGTSEDSSTATSEETSEDSSEGTTEVTADEVDDEDKLVEKIKDEDEGRI